MQQADADQLTAQALSAACGAALSTLVFFPLELIKTRLQGQVVSSTGTKNREGKGVVGAAGSARDAGERQYGGFHDVWSHLVEDEGVLGLFRGLAPVMFRSVLSDTLYFFTAAALRARLERSLARELSMLEALLSGYVSACLTQLVAHPVDTITNRVMSDQSREGASVGAHVRRIYEEHGVAGFWRNYTASLLLSLNPALQFTCFERAKELALQRSGQRELSAAQLFQLGVVTKACTLTLIYPLIRAKVYSQAASGPDAPKTQAEALRRVVEHEGVRGLYKGLREQLGKSTLSTALLLTTKEEIGAAIERALVRLREAQAKGAAAKAKQLL